MTAERREKLIVIYYEKLVACNYKDRRQIHETYMKLVGERSVGWLGNGGR